MGRFEHRVGSNHLSADGEPISRQVGQDGEHRLVGGVVADEQRGTRPAKGGEVINAVTAVPLLKCLGLTSITALPNKVSTSLSRSAATMASISCLKKSLALHDEPVMHRDRMQLVLDQQTRIGLGKRVEFTPELLAQRAWGVLR